MLRFTLMATFIGVCAPAFAAEGINKDYIKSLAAPGKNVAVIEYQDGNGKVVDRKGFATSNKWTAISPTQFKVSQDVTLSLYGLTPCSGELVVRSEGFTGKCDEYAKSNLQVMLNDPKVIFCRAFISEQNAKEQDVTCYGYYFIPNGIDSVDMLEEQLVSIGALQVRKGADGKLLRPDLAEAQQIGRKGYGMWADPRYKSK